MTFYIFSVPVKKSEELVDFVTTILICYCKIGRFAELLETRLFLALVCLPRWSDIPSTLSQAIAVRGSNKGNEP